MEAKFSKDAENDIRSLITYGLSTYSEIVAKTYFSELSDCLGSLAKNPLMAPLCLRQNSNIRRFVFRAHVIYFAIYPPTILVLRVLHQRQDPIIEFID
jgi:toxin ParE1/3/4